MLKNKMKFYHGKLGTSLGILLPISPPKRERAIRTWFLPTLEETALLVQPLPTEALPALGPVWQLSAPTCSGKLSWPEMR